MQAVSLPPSERREILDGLGWRPEHVIGERLYYLSELKVGKSIIRADQCCGVHYSMLADTQRM